MVKKSALPVFWQIGHDLPCSFLSSHNEATTMIVAEGPQPKKPIRPAAGAARFRALAAMGRLVGSGSSRSCHRHLRGWIGSECVGGKLLGGRILGPPPRSRAQDRPVRVPRWPPLAQPMVSRPPGQRCRAMARSGDSAESLGSVRFSRSDARQGVRAARRCDSPSHGRGADHGRSWSARWHGDSGLRLKAPPGR